MGPKKRQNRSKSIPRMFWCDKDLDIMLSLITTHLNCTRQKALEALIMAGVYYINSRLEDTLCIIDPIPVDSGATCTHKLFENKEFMGIIRKFVSNTNAVSAEFLQTGCLKFLAKQDPTPAASIPPAGTSYKRKRAKSPTSADIAAWWQKNRRGGV